MTSLVQIAGLLQDAPADTGGWSGASGSGSVLIVLFLLLIGSSVAVWIFLKRGTFPRIKGGQQLQILETRVLGGRQYLVVASHGDQKFLLGVCPGRIDYLCPLENASAGSTGEAFATVLQDREAPHN